ncbi:MAG: DUF945 family protein [Porticoccaceae bacterium]
MKRVLLGSVLVVIGLWVLGVVFFGRAAEIKVDDQIAELNSGLLERSVPLIITQLSYESGFLSSNSRIQLNIDRGNSQALVIDVDQDIYHGPLMLTPSGLKFGAYYIAFTPDIAALLDEKGEAQEFLDSFPERKPLSGGFLLNLWGGQSFDLALAPFTFSDDEKSVTLKNGIVGTFSGDDNFSRLNCTVEFGAFAIEGEAEAEALAIDIAASTLTMDITEMHAGSMLAGELDYALNSIVVKAEGAEHRVDGITLNSLSDKNDAGLYGNANFIMESIASDDDNFNAMFSEPLNFRLDFNYEGLNEQATREFAEINQKVNGQVYKALLNPDETTGLEGLSEEHMQAYIHAMAALVGKGLKFDYGFTLGQGDASSGLNFVFDWVDANGLMDKKTVREVLTAFKADVKVNVDKAFFDGTDFEDMAQMPVMMGYAVATGQGIESHALFNRGELLLNGESVPYMDMMGATLNEELPWAQ